MTEDERSLDLLGLFHYIVGGLTALFACIPLIHVTIGLLMVSGKFEGPQFPGRLFGWLFVVVGGIFVLGGWALAVAMLVAAGKLKRRQSLTYCIVVAPWSAC